MVVRCRRESDRSPRLDALLVQLELYRMVQGHGHLDTACWRIGDRVKTLDSEVDEEHVYGTILAPLRCIIYSELPIALRAVVAQYKACFSLGI